MQEFKRAAKGSSFVGRALVEEFKRGINRGVRRKLMEAEQPPKNIEQWYKRAVNLDRHWRECVKLKAVDFIYSPFNSCFLFSILRTKERVRVTVTSHDMVTVMITSHMMHRRT